jgi:hypothetical protein
MLHSPRIQIRSVLFGLIAATGIAAAVQADEGRRDPRVPLLAKYQQECAACHTAYPPGMLPAVSWQRITSNLPHHFGADASLDPAAAKEISAWLAANAGTYKRAGAEPPLDRITLSPWFVRKHNEVSAATWKLPAVKSAANCSACHSRSDQGDFNEHNVRIPR